MKHDDQNPVTIREVAKESGVSIATVSRVLNDSESVTAKTRTKVCEAMVMLGYNRNAVARSLKIRKTKTIGIIAPELSNTFFMEILEAMESIFARKEYTMVVCSSNNSVEEERKKLQVLIERTVDALVIIPVSDEGRHLRHTGLDHIPLVILDRQIPSLNTDTVCTDNGYGVRIVMQKLLEEGFTRIGFLGGSLTIPTAKERYLGYLESMHRANLPVEEAFVCTEGAMDQRRGFSIMQKFMQDPDHPQAFFIANDMLHLGATSFLMEAYTTKTRPHLVFASFDHLYYSSLLQLCHYAVCQPLEQIGKSVATLLLRRLEGDWSDFPRLIVHRPEIKVMVANGGIQGIVQSPDR
ncbi:LacI family DNA-binding transcriptional regulator [Sphaerochaeta sp. PS]|uniref:LacI family DNA-binding transcriptional regulator n=1 Tax=Sphaerochaeta sp. PS TaxID=3076336 RepID=UPI0028A3B332|nr:LacI family DNA-binding transcriptional regulator [Sphaerochaeta sp. PS]MDT4761106.1 LacI family DNA-binding transcriptional regulator [Sphaerochaeta sp. PS]